MMLGLIDLFVFMTVFISPDIYVPDFTASKM